MCTVLLTPSTIPRIATLLHIQLDLQLLASSSTPTPRLAMAMHFDASAAQRLLTDANTHFAAMLPATNGLQGQHDVTGHAKSYVAAVQALQQQLAAFAAPTPSTHKAALEAQVSALEQELSRADALLRETSMLTQQWQMRCQDLHKRHEDVLTKGIGTQTAPAATPQQPPQDTPMEDAQT